MGARRHARPGLCRRRISHHLGLLLQRSHRRRSGACAVGSLPRPPARWALRSDLRQSCLLRRWPGGCPRGVRLRASLQRRRIAERTRPGRLHDPLRRYDRRPLWGGGGAAMREPIWNAYLTVQTAMAYGTDAWTGYCDASLALAATIPPPLGPCGPTLVIGGGGPRGVQRAG